MWQPASSGSLEHLLYDTYLVAGAEVADTPSFIDKGNKRKLYLAKFSSLYNALLQQSLLISKVGIHQPP